MKTGATLDVATDHPDYAQAIAPAWKKRLILKVA
jgi:hypothetical protein